MNDSYELPQKDIDILRGLAGRKAEIAELPENLERKELWYRHDSGTLGRPMVLAEIIGVTGELFPKDHLKCESLRGMIIEGSLRGEIYQFDVLRDDHVVEPHININWNLMVSDYGVQPVAHTTHVKDKMTSKKWDPPIVDLDNDFDKLHPRTFAVDREGTFRKKESLEKAIGDILPVRIRGFFGMLPWTMGLTMHVMMLHGLDNLMINTIDNPDGLHRLMKFLYDDHVAYAEWLEREGLLTLNNENDYMGSGSMGYTRDLPQPGGNDDKKVRKKDIWILLESQETVGVGPKQFEEIFFPYQLDLAKKFGRCYYGCCEPLNSRWRIIKQIPNLARVSVSAWADEEFMARELGSDYIYSRKPNPTLISTGNFNENLIRSDIRNTLTIADGCRVEFVMKDVHTLNKEPGRLPRWVEIARDEIDKLF